MKNVNSFEPINLDYYDFSFSIFSIIMVVVSTYEFKA